MVFFQGRPVGGIFGLPGFLIEYGEAVEYDLAIRGIDLRDVVRGVLPVRRLLVLIRGLVEDPSTWVYRLLTGGWSLSDHLSAAIVDEVRLANYLFVRVNSRKGSAGKPPDPVVRPGLPARKTNESTVGRTTKTPEEMIKLLAQFDPPPDEG